MSSSRSSIGVGLVIVGATLFIVNAGMSRVAMRAGVTPSMLTTVRVTGTFLALLLIAAFFRRSALRIPRGRIRLLIAHGIVGVALLQWTYFVAIDRLPIGMALLLEYQAPILVALWAMLVQRQPVRARIWFGLALAVLGLGAATEVWRGARFDTIGIIAGLGAALCFAAYFLIGEAGVSALDPLQVILWAFGFATIAWNAFVPITGFDLAVTTHVSLLGGLDHLQLPLWAVLGWIIALGTLVPFFAELLALSFVNATTVTMIAMLEPIGVAALGWAWFGESLGTVAIIGCLAVVGGILIAQLARTSPVAEPTVLT